MAQRRTMYLSVIRHLYNILKYTFYCIILTVLVGYVNRNCLQSVLYKHPSAEPLCNISRKNVLDARLRLPNYKTIDKAEESTLLNILQSYVKEKQWKCCYTEKFKQQNDRDVVICLDEINKTGMTCTVFIFGYTPGLEFENVFWDGYYCLLRVFDSRVNVTNLHVSSHFAFHNWGLSEKVAQKSYPRNLTDICKRLDHVNKTIDILKLNAGAFDWMVLLRTVENDELKLVKQLLLDIEIDNNADDNIMKIKIAVLRNLFERGFRIFAVESIHFSTGQYNIISVSMINMNCYGIF